MAGKSKDTRLYRVPESRFIWARVRLPNGTIGRRSTRCVDEAAASLWADEFERRAAPGYCPPRTCSLADALDAHLADLGRRGRSEGTRQKCAVKALALLAHFGEATEINTLNGAGVLAYIDARSFPYGPRKKTRHPSTIAMEVQLLVAALKLARFSGLYHGDPMALLPPGLGGGARARTRFLDADEAAALVARGFSGPTRKKEAQERAGCVAFILGSGARMSGLRNALRSDIDLEAGTVTVRDTKTAWGVRTLPISSLMRPWLELALKLGRGERQTSKTRTGKLFSRWANPQRDIALGCEAAGIEACTPNDLRRTFAQWHDRAGLAPKALSALMGHAPGSTTTAKHYAQTTLETLTAAMSMQGLHTPMLKRSPGTTPSAGNDLGASEGGAANALEDSAFLAPAAGVEPATNALGKRFPGDAQTAFLLRREPTVPSPPMLKRVRVAEVAVRRKMRSPLRSVAAEAVRCVRGVLLAT